MPLDDVNSILEEITSTALEPDYQNHRPRKLSNSIRHQVVAAIGLLVVGFLVSNTISLGLLNKEFNASASKGTREKLVAQIEKALIYNDDLTVQVRDLTKSINGNASKKLAMTKQGKDLNGKIESLAPIAGEMSIIGNGVRISMSQNNNETPIMDSDLQFVVNELWASGAEAISISNIRLTATSSIRHAGNAVLIDYRPVSSPYVLDVIGDPIRLRGQVENGSLRKYLNDLKKRYGINTSIVAKPRITIPGRSVGELRFSQPTMAAGDGSVS